MVMDTADTICTRHAYSFDARTIRKSLSTATGGPDEDCPSSDGIAVTTSYDPAAR